MANASWWYAGAEEAAEAAEAEEDEEEEDEDEEDGATAPLPRSGVTAKFKPCCRKRGEWKA